MIHKNLIKDQQGQALVMIILVVLISLSIGVAVSSQALISSRQAVNEEYSSQAITYAESGAEVALKDIKDNPSGTIPRTVLGDIDGDGADDYEYTIDEAGSAASNIYEIKIDKDQVAQVDLGGVPAGANVNIYWWNGTQTNAPDTPAASGMNCIATRPAAIEFTYAAQDTATGDYLIRRKEAYDMCANIAGNEFTNISSGSYSLPAASGNIYQLLATNGTYSISGLSSDSQRIVRIRAWYDDTWVALELLDSAGGSTLSLPIQGYEIISTGNSGDTERTIRVTKTSPYLPAIFDYALFSGGDLLK